MAVPAITKGARTRQRIVERAAPVFNQRGYAGASMRDLVEATGLEKGGIYNHFGSKEALAVAALDHAVELMTARFAEARTPGAAAADLLIANVRAFAEGARNPIIAGGCPIMNTAIEADDTNPELREHARRAMTDWHRLIGSMVKHGVAANELIADVNPYALATLITSSLEGALMLSQLYDDPTHMDRVVDHLVDHIETRRAPDSSRARE
jgi:TetR/AcrR family transcriptional regulator, transcriptional repressor for nem operon